MRYLIILLALSAAWAQPAALVDYVNPLVGSDSSPAFSHGNNYPAVALPFGMTFWTPQTGKPGNSWLYTYKATAIHAFRATHQPSPWIGDYGDFSFMPIAGELVTDWQQRSSTFDHRHEEARPYYYSVMLDKHNIRVELTPTTRAMQSRITFSQAGNAYLLLQAHPKGAYVKIIPEEKKVIGFTRANEGGVPENFACYFVAYLDQPFKTCGVWQGNQTQPDCKELSAEEAGVYLQFQGPMTVTMRIATSFISFEQAERNLASEVGKQTFAQTCQEAKEIWEKEMHKIEIEGATPDQQITFYTALYRALLFPRIWYEYGADKQKIHFSPYDGKVHPGEMYADNGFWDTFRAVYPFFTLLHPDRDAEIIRAWINAYKEGGWFPKWTSPGYRDCMIGTHVESLVADAYLKGIRDFDVESAWQAMIKDGTTPTDWGGRGRVGLPEYMELGYVACDKTKEATARTLEFAYDDFCIAQMARALGKSEDEKYFASRSLNYLKVWDPQVGFMRGRLADGSWRPHFDPFEWGNPFTEGSAWHYTWSVMHNIQGLINLMGGREAFCTKLDSMFTLPAKFSVGHYKREIHEMTEMVACNMGQYAHGNQPVHHVLYLYDYAGQPWKTQKWVRHAVSTLYGPGPDGLCGDEDNGQMSVWYLFSAIGFYPVCPGEPSYVIGSPLFSKVTLHLANGKQFVIVGNNNSAKNVYIDSVGLNGKTYDKTYIPHQTIMDGGMINLNMSETPNTSWGVQPESAPFSMHTR
jgi:predicted alpha-1,2-mannosidase